MQKVKIDFGNPVKNLEGQTQGPSNKYVEKLLHSRRLFQIEITDEKNLHRLINELTLFGFHQLYDIEDASKIKFIEVSKNVMVFFNTNTHVTTITDNDVLNYFSKK